MKQNELRAIQHQMKMHEQLKGWLKTSFILTSVMAALLWFSMRASLWVSVIAGILLTISLLALLLIGFGLWRSYNDLRQKLQ